MDRFQILKNSNLKPCYAPKPEFPVIHFNPMAYVYSQLYGRNSGRATFVIDTEAAVGEQLIPSKGSTSAQGMTGIENVLELIPEEYPADQKPPKQFQTWTRHRKKLPWE
jgi:hypothetical protein